jgi:hypothetical protein
MVFVFLFASLVFFFLMTERPKAACWSLAVFVLFLLVLLNHHMTSKLPISL